MNETLIKYLSGLLDADGCLSFQFVNTKQGIRVYLRLVLVCSEAVDKEGKFIKSLPFGSIVSSQIGNWSLRNDWVITKWNELNMIIPRLLKHMVIKAKHWQWMFDMSFVLRGKTINSSEMEVLKAASKESRKNNTGPLKSKSHPTWAWVAGYLDGDGSYQNQYNSKKKHHVMRVNCTSHINDIIGLELLKKAFGGTIYYPQDNLARWQHNLGFKDTSFVLRFLPKIVFHSKLKKHKIEQIIHNHKQRLNDLALKGDVIV